MAIPKILVCLDTDPQPSVFDGVVAVDAGVDQLFRHGGVTADDVRNLVYGAMFTRGPADLKNTAVFIGGSDVAAGEQLLAKARECFFEPMRVSLMLDSNGANTTAAAAVICARKHVTLSQSAAVVLAATGSVGRRVVRLLARECAYIRVVSRQVARAQQVVNDVLKLEPNARLETCATSEVESVGVLLDGQDFVIAAGAPGVELLSDDALRAAKSLKLAIDLNAVPPAGIGGIQPTDKAVEKDGLICYGAIGVGGMKMKLHKAAVRRLFESNDAVLDAEEIFALGGEL
jgi:hypothetical protein